MKVVLKSKRRIGTVPLVILIFFVLVIITICYCLNSKPSNNSSVPKKEIESTTTCNVSGHPLCISTVLVTKAVTEHIFEFSIVRSLVEEVPAEEPVVEELPVQESANQQLPMQFPKENAVQTKPSKPQVEYTKPTQTTPPKDNVTQVPNQGTTQRPSQDNVIEVPNNSVTQRPNQDNVVEVPNTGGNQNNQGNSDSFDTSKIRISSTSNGEIAHVSITGLDSKCVVNWNGVMDSNDGFYYGHTFSSTTITITRDGKTIFTQNIKV